MEHFFVYFGLRTQQENAFVQFRNEILNFRRCEEQKGLVKDWSMAETKEIKWGNNN